MQRWIAAAVVAMILMGVGAFYGRKIYHENAAAPVWVPLPIDQLPPDKVDSVVKELKTKLSEDAVLLQVSKDLSLPVQWHLPGDPQAAAEVRKRLFVRIGEMDAKLGKVPAILVGVNGKTKERDLSGKIALRLMEDVAKILRFKNPTKP